MSATGTSFHSVESTPVLATQEITSTKQVDSPTYQKEEETAGTPAVYNKAVLFILFEVVMVIPVLLMCWWVFGYLGGLDWSSENKYKFNWHPLAMIIGMFLLFGNGNIYVVICTVQ